MSTYTDAILVFYPSGYKASKAYSLKPTNGSGDLTFTRASTATRTNASGLIESVATGVPRIDFTGGGCAKLLLEPQRTNLATYSNEFNNGAWTKARSSVSANVAVSPDGTTNADKIVEDTSTNSHALSRAVSNTSGQQYSVSVYVKAAERTWFAIYVGGGPGQGRYFNLSDGTLGSAFGNTPNASIITDAGNGWHRCSIVYTATDASSDVGLQIASANGTNVYTGNGTSGIYMYGAQTELGSLPTSYIPTVASAVTRVVDSASVTTPAGVTQITETFSDGSTNVITTIPTTYTATLGSIQSIIMI
jgi:hypothetical protein